MIWIPSGQQKLYLTRYQPKSAVICLAFGHNTAILLAEEGGWLQTSNLEISHAGTPSAENYLKKVLHVNSEKLRTIRITQVKADL